MSSDPNWPSRYSHPTRAAKRANLAEKVAWALKDAQAEIDSLTVLLGQAQKDRDEFARAEDRERTRAECALVALAAAEARADRLAEAAKKLRDKMQATYSDPRYMNVWAIAQAHVGPYTGPDWIAEAEALAAALAEEGRR